MGNPFCWACFPIGGKIFFFFLGILLPKRLYMEVALLFGVDWLWKLNLLLSGLGERDS
jgi:hypothetical protein